MAEDAEHWKAELRSFCRLILERKFEEELSTHVAVSFLEEDAALIVQRAERLMRETQQRIVLANPE